MRQGERGQACHQLPGFRLDHEHNRMLTNATLKTTLAMLLAGLCTVALAQTKYWTGGQGAWSDGAHWSLTPTGPGGAGAPRADEIVVIAPSASASIDIQGAARCKGLLVNGANGAVSITGPANAELTIAGDWRLVGDVTWPFAGATRLVVRREGVEVDLCGRPLGGSLVLDGSGSWSALSDMVMEQGDVVMREGTLITNGNLLKAHALRTEGHGAKRLIGGRSVVMLDMPPALGALNPIVDPTGATLSVGGAPVTWNGDAPAIDDRDVNVCGTGPGQTPFVVTATLVSNFNGYGVRCRGNCNGTVTVNVTGGSGTFSYSWLFGGPPTQTWTAACGGPQIVIVTDVTQGISCPVQVNVTEPAPLGVIFFGQGTPPTCADVCNGSRTALAVGGVSPYSYSWNNGAGTGSSFFALCAGNNTLHITDFNLCTFDTAFFFNLLPVSPNLTITNANCFGQCDGTASVVPSGGTPTYSVVWTPPPPIGQGTNNASGLCPGNYSVTVTDFNGCDTTVVFAITAPPPILPNLTFTNASCFGACDGTANVLPAGAPGPYTYVWAPAPGTGQGTGSVTGLCAGAYTVLITDQTSGCDTLVSVTIISPGAIIVQGTVTDATCADVCDGTIGLSVSGGQAPYVFLWSPVPPVGQGTGNVSGLCPGDWSVTVTDAGGCDTTVTFTVSAPPPIDPTLTTTDVTCAGACDGTATVTVTGGVGPFGFVWTPAPAVGQGTDTVTGLCAGNYSLTITDANGCDTTVTFTISEPPPLIATPTQTNVTCGTLCDGTASVLVSGGTMPYTYVWTPAPPAGQGTPNISGLCAGAYSVLITDANGCTLTVPFTITSPAPILVSLQVLPASCPGVCDGSAGVIVSGGTSPYGYNWLPAPGTGQGTPNVTGLCPQAYTVTITDAVGCDTTIAFTVPAPPPITVTAVVTDATCNGDCDGSIVLTVSGGNGAFTYLWAPAPPVGQGTGSISALCTGDWEVTITSGACDTTLTYTIQEPPPIDAALVTTDPNCAGDCDGTATVVVTGGAAPYDYSWSPAPPVGQGTPSVSGLCPGNYTLTVTDVAGCDTTLAFVINAPVPLSAVIVITPASCGGLCDGTATATPSGGTGPYDFLWGPGVVVGQGTPGASALCPGAYTLTLTDALGCDTTILFTVNTPSGIVAVPTVTNASCADVCDGTIILSTGGGLPPYIYTWSPSPPVGQGTPSVSGLCPGTWTVVISDGAACDTVMVFDITSPTPIIPNAVSTNESCNGPCDGTASVAPTGGQAPYLYLWTPVPPSGQGLPTATGLCPGIWSLLITDPGGCDTTVVFTILPEQPIDAGLVALNGPCANECGGSASVSPTGGIPPFTFLWIPTPPIGQGTSAVSGLCIGNWQVLVTDAAGCDTSIAFAITTPPPIQPGLVVTSETCLGACSGSATLTPAGGSGPIVIDWQPPPGGGQGTNTATGLCAGTNYTVTLTDGNACDTTMAFTVAPFSAIIANSSSTPASCAGVCDGTATVGPTGGVAPYTYVWSPAPIGQGTPQATGLCTGVISVTITDATGCSITQDILITEPTPILDDPAVINVACAGQCTGSIVLNPSGGTAPYLIVWTPVPPNGQGTNSALNLCVGTWDVVITDANGCSAPFSYTVIEPPLLTLVTQNTPSQCQVCIGTATAVITGGVSPYDVVWTNASGTTVGTTENVTDLCAGIYTVTVTDANGCSAQQAVPITDSNGEVLTTVDGNTSCPNTCDGAVSVNFTCGDPSCVVAWYDSAGNDLGQSGTSLSGLCPGIYFVGVTNASGCLALDTATVIAPAPTVLLISSSPVTCAGACDGTAAVGISGGIAPYVIVWDPPPGGGQGTPLATGLCAGVYTVTVSDAGGCDTTASVLITEPLPLDVTATVIDVSCEGQCDGNITLAPFGGVAPYTFFWAPIPPNGQGVSAAFGLCAGDWTATVTDANGCSVTDTYTITEPAVLQVSANTTPTTCPNCDGTASAVVTGGTGPFLFSWVVGGVEVSSDQDATGLCGGLYSLTVSDVNGCSVTIIVPLSDSNAEVLTITDGQTSCASDCDGTVSVSFTCTSPTCSTIWTDVLGNVISVNTLTLTDLCTGTYTVQVTNGSGCVSIANASVLPSQIITPNLSTTPVGCSGACDGTATVGPTGGVTPYTYVWDPPPPIGQGTPQAQGLCAGIYTVTIADSLGCDTTIALLIVEPAPLVQSALVQNASCAGTCDGSIVVTPSGGTGPFLFFWTPVPPNGQGGNSATDLCAGAYSLLLTDANGCDTTVAYTIMEPLPISLVGNTSPSACGVCSGAVNVMVSGGTGPYLFAWTSGGNLFGTNDTLANICAGFYTVLVTDANLCQATLLVPVSDIDGEVTTTTDGLTTCPGDCDGVVNVVFNCGDPPCTISWYDASGNSLNGTGNQLDSLCAGLYLVQVINGTGCITIDTAYVDEPDPILPNLSTTPVTCNGACDGSATVGPTGGVPPYGYVWDPVPPIGQGTPQAQGLCAGVWTVVISDSVGCSITVDVLITEPPLLIADATVTPITCNGACDGVIVVIPQGGVAPYVFNWSPVPPNGNGTDTGTGLCADDWLVTVSDANGCDTTITITLVDPPVLDATVTTTNNICFGDCLGTAEAVITGGVAPYSTVWRDAGGNTIAAGVDSIGGLCAGDYTFEVNDANGCLFSTPFTITEGTPIVANLTTTNETCFGPCDGTASIAPSGGTGPYTVLWQPPPPVGQGSTLASGLCAGAWSLTITDALGCDSTYAFTILPFDPILANATVSDVQCNGDCNGSIVLAATGGLGGYIYLWNPVPPNGQGTATATGLCPGDHDVTISDVIGCDSTFTFTITEPSAVSITVDQVTPATCADAADGSIGTTATGGTPPYVFGWAGPGGFNSALEDLAGLLPGDYTLIVTDSHNCTDTVVVTVDALITVVADAGPDQSVCFNVAILLDGSQSVGALTYTWTDDQSAVIGTDTTVSLGPLSSGPHTFTLTVTNGPCSSSDQVSITVLDLPIADAGPDHAIVLGEPVTLGGTPTGPTGSTFLWTPDSALTSGAVSNPLGHPSVTTWFTVLVTAPNGCQDLDSVLVTVIPEVVIPSGFTPNGDGWNDVWVIDYIDLFPLCEVEVYNRWGELLFQSVGYKQPWDGRYNDGFVPVGTYYYVVKLNDPRFPDAYTGPLTVIR
ncbi:MAG: gliding motility-associated C-terminal domain-containing protein [Flavobacteriales bacterium]